MLRDARLYHLQHLDWKPLISQVKKKNQHLKSLIVVFKNNRLHLPIHFYSLLSMHEDLDRLIEDYGGIEADPTDLLRNALHRNTPKPLYGDKSSVVKLRKIHQ